MLIQNCNLLLVVITKIESMIADSKAQHPNLSDEEIFDQLRKALGQQNKI